MSVDDEARGRAAFSPRSIPLQGWKDIFWRVYREFFEDRVMLVAAGVTFYLLLSIFPAIAAMVSLYGLIGDPSVLAEHLSTAEAIVPTEIISLLQGQLLALSEQESGALGVGAILGLGVAIWSTNAGMKSLFEAMNVAYEEQEKRSFVRLTAETLLATVGAMVVLIAFVVAIGVLPVIMAAIGMSGIGSTLIYLLRWPVLLLMAGLAITLLYRYGPSRETARWEWVIWGAGIATITLVIASVGFSVYLSHFANYSATYGSLGTVVGFLMWMWVSCLILIGGAELSAEIEHQTAHDSTTGAEMPLGDRGAHMADTIGEPQD